jgi:ribosomal protein L31
MSFREGDRVAVRMGLGRSVVGTVAQDWQGAGPVLIVIDGKTKAVPRETAKVRLLSGRAPNRPSPSAPSPTKVTRSGSTAPIALRPVPRPAIPSRSPKYLDFVRSHPCAYCKVVKPIEAHHWAPHRGMSTKPDDYRAIPLCSDCHTHYHQHGSLKNLDPRTTREFFQQRQIDLLVEWISRGKP